MEMRGYIRLNDERGRRRSRKNREQPAEKPALNIGQVSVDALNKAMIEKEAQKEDKPEIERESE